MTERNDYEALATVLVDVCNRVLQDSLRDNGQDFNQGQRYISEDSVSNISNAVDTVMPDVSDIDRSILVDGICTGLAVSVRFIEAKWSRSLEPIHDLLYGDHASPSTSIC